MALGCHGVDETRDQRLWGSSSPTKKDGAAFKIATSWRDRRCRYVLVLPRWSLTNRTARALNSRSMFFGVLHIILDAHRGGKPGVLQV